MDKHDNNNYSVVNTLRQTVPLLFLILALQPLKAEQAVRAELYSLTQAVSPGRPFTLAVVLSMPDGWHTYWDNPGDAGMATRFDWQAPEGCVLQAKQAPAPTRHTSAGMTSFIHEKEAIYFFDWISNEPPADSVRFALDVDWLECREICRPGKARLTLALPIGEDSPGSQDAWLDLIERAEARFPEPEWPFRTSIRVRGDEIRVRLPKSKNTMRIQDVDFFPLDEMTYDLSETPILKQRRHDEEIRLFLLPQRDRNPSHFRGIIQYTVNTPTGDVSRQAFIHEPINP